MKVAPAIRALCAAIAMFAFSPQGTRAADGQMTWALHATLVPSWFEPAETSPGVLTPFLVLYALHDALVKPLPGNPMAPSLAESWTTSPDGLVYDFVLRKGITFHDGSPVTAADVKFSFERYRAAAAAMFRARVLRVETPSETEVRFVLREPWPDFMTFYGSLSTSAGWIVPRAYIERVGDDGFKKHPIGAGPYRFVSFTPGVELVLEAYDGYWRKKPSVKRLVLKSVPEEATRLAMLKRSEADIAYVLSGPIAEEVRRSPSLTLKPTYPPTILWLTFTEQWQASSPLADRRVRLAINYALDRKGNNEATHLGFAKLTGSIIPDHFQDALKAAPYEYDPDRARQLLAEAGHPDGFDAGDLFVDMAYVPVAEAVANDLAAVGIRVRLRPMERGAFYGQFSEKKLHGIVLSISGAFGNAATRLEEFVSSRGRYAYGVYPDIEALLEGQAKEPDPAKRSDLLRRAQQLMLDKVMFAPVLHSSALMAYGPRVAESGMELILGDPYSSPYEEVRLKPN